MEHIFRNHEVDFDINYAYSMKNFPMFLWSTDHFLDIIICNNSSTYHSFEPIIPKDLIMNLKKLEIYFLCTWYFHQKSRNYLWKLFAKNMIMNKKCSYKYLMVLTNNTYLSFITRFAQFVPEYDFRNMSIGMFKLDIQTNIMASTVYISKTLLDDEEFDGIASYMDYKNRWINYQESSAEPSLMQKIFMRIHMIQHAFRPEIDASFVWFACMYVALEDLLCMATWMELLMFKKRIYSLGEISQEALKKWRSECYDMSIGIMSFGRGILKLLNIIVNCDINGLDYIDCIHQRNIEIPPESVLGFIGVEIFRLDKTWHQVYAKIRKNRLKMVNINVPSFYTKNTMAYAPVLNNNDQNYSCIIANGIYSHIHTSMIMNYDFVMLEGLEQVLFDPIKIIRDFNGTKYCCYTWIFGCDYHTSTMTKILNAAYKGGFERNSSAISISLFPINYKYLFDNSQQVTKIASKYHDCDYLSHSNLYCQILFDIRKLPYGIRQNTEFLDTMDQPGMIKILLNLCWLFQFSYNSLVSVIADSELLFLK